MRKPFDMLRDINTDESIKKAPNPLELGASIKWRGIRDLNIDKKGQMVPKGGFGTQIPY